MPTPVSYLSGNTLSYQSGMVKKGTVGLNLTSSLTGNYRWWNGVEVTASQYLIYSDTYSTGASTESNVTPAAWSTPNLTDQSLLNLINTLPDRIGQTAFTTLSNALIWLNESGEYFLIKNSYENIVTSGLTLNLDAAWTNSYATGTTTWNDLSGSGNTFTLLNGVAFNSSDYGSLTFDGTDDYTKTTASFMNGATQGTFEFWFQTSSISGGGSYYFQRNTLIGKASGPDNGLGFSTTSNRLRFRLADSNLDSTIELNTNVIYHVVGTWDSGGSKIYINGVLNNSNNTANLSWYTSQFETIIGRVYVGSAGASFTGKIYSARAYNRALLQSEILQNYHVTKQRFGFNNIVGTNLVLNLNSQNNISYSGGGTSWFDLTGNNNTGTLTNGPTFNTTERSIVFDGTDDYVQTNYSGITGTNPRTFSVWFKPDTLQNRNLLGYGTQSDKRMWDILLYNDTVGVHLYNSGNEAGTPYTVGQWQNATFTYSHPTIKSYMNGVYKNSVSISAINTGSDSNLNIGKGTYSPYFYFDGNMSTTQIYDRELSATEVLQNYYQGNIVTNGLVLALDAGNLVSYGGTGTLLKDLTNTTTGATLVNGPTYTTSNGGGIVLDGADDYILVNRTASLEPTAITMQCVFYMGTFTNYPGIIAKGYWDSQTTPKDIEGYGMHIRPNYNLWVDFNNNGTRQILQGDGQDGQGVNAGITQNSLNFITVTIGPTGAKIYNKGINYYSDNVNYTIAYTGNNGGTVPADLWIGWMQYKGGTLDGKIYTASIYNRALSQSEIIQNFNAHKSRYGL
jgi:hypothetical protein